jgi:hypothetical protein
MSRIDTKAATFTAQTSWGPVEVRILKPVSLFGLSGFAAHRKLKKHRHVRNSVVVSHIGTGYWVVPAAPARSADGAVRNCIAALEKRGIDRERIEKRIAELSRLDKEA